ncbi:MAG: cell division protein ZapA [Alistipes sp.]|nr:cell division protein ZapA [Alistipes sp.]
MSEVKKQNITLRILGKSYQFSVKAEREEEYRLAEQVVNDQARKYETAHIEGFTHQDCLALSAMDIALDNIRMSRSREVGNEDVKQINRLAQRIENYLNSLDHEQ